MTLFTRFWRWLGGNATRQESGTQINYPDSAAHQNTKIYTIDGALQVSTVWACVTLLVEVISSLPIKLYERDETGSKNEVPSAVRLVKILTSSPNRLQTAQEFWETMLLSFFLRGNAYARIDRDAKGEVLSLWPLAADQVEVRRLADGSVWYHYKMDQEVLIFGERDILHIRGMGNGLIGMAPLDYMRASVGLAINSQDHTNRTYAKNAKRPGVLMTDMVLDSEQRAALKKNFGDIVTGSDRELFILEAQFKFEPLGMTPADIELLETRKFSVQDIARWFGVPSVLINDTGETTALGTGVAQIIEAFYKLKLRPQLSRIESAIEKRVMSATQRAKGYQVEFKFDAILRASLKDRMEIYARAVQNGIKTRNECRSLEGDPPVDAGDTLTVQSNLVPIELLGETATQGGGVEPEPVEQ